jgi:F0F1-type ATP synthase membrane subunit c/vacuolar-type H+-ATPase subunit K
MNTITEYQQRIEEQKIIKEETGTTMIIGLALLASTIIFGLASYLIKLKPVMGTQALDNLRGALSLIVVLLMIGILAIRRSIYYSPRFIEEDFTLRQVLQKWRTIDIVLLALAETIPICGLVLALLGLPFDKNFHFFVGAGVLIIILMPMGIKVRSKLSILRQHFPDI